jgi:Flp pilus assembly protein TadD
MFKKLIYIIILPLFIFCSQQSIAKNVKNRKTVKKVNIEKSSIFDEASKEKSENLIISSDEIVKEIERSLLFDNDSKERADFYNKKDIRKSVFTLEAGNKKKDNKNKDKEKKADDGEESNKQDKAIAEVIIIDGKKDDIDLREKEKLAYNAAIIGQYEVAIELYKKILEKEPDNQYVKFAMAVNYQNIRQFRQAKSIYYQLLKSNPDNNQEIINNLLAIIIEENPRDASYILTRLTVQNPTSAAIMSQAALAFEKIKDYNQAIYLLKKAITIDNNNIEYFYNLAIIYDKNEDYDNAISYYMQTMRKIAALDNNNYFNEAKQIEARLSTIKELNQ